MIKGFHVPTDCIKLVLSICRMSWSKDVRNVDPQKWAPTNSDDSILLHVYCKSGYLWGGGGRFALKLRIKLKTVKTTPTHPLPLYGKKIKTSVW